MFGCGDIKRSCLFYDALLAPLGITRRKVTDNNPAFACWVDQNNPSTKFFVCLPFNNAEASVGNGSMVAFNAASTNAVDVAYQAGMSHGGSDEGAPGLRPHYGNGYYGAYLQDPDGNKVHLVHHGANADKL